MVGLEQCGRKSPAVEQRSERNQGMSVSGNFPAGASAQELMSGNFPGSVFSGTVQSAVKPQARTRSSETSPGMSVSGIFLDGPQPDDVRE